MICINGLSNKLAKTDAPTWHSRYAAFPVCLPLSDQHRLGAQEFESKPLALFYLATDAIHNSTQVSPTLTKLCILGEQGHTEKHLQARGCHAGNLSVILGSVRCFGVSLCLPSSCGRLGPTVLPALLPLASPSAQRALRRSPSVYAAGWNQLQVIPKNTFCPYFFNAMVENSFALKPYVPRRPDEPGDG